MHRHKAESSPWPRLLAILALLCALACLVWWLAGTHREQESQIRDFTRQVQMLHERTSEARTLALTAHESSTSVTQVLTDSSETLKQLRAKLEEVSQSLDTTKKVEGALQPLQAQLRGLETQITDLNVRMAQRETTPAPKTSTSAAETQPLNASDELILLKERNRLTLHADEAMATSKAAPLRALWASLRDPQLRGLKHAAAAEIIRVQNHANLITRVPPDFRLAADETKLSTEELTTILLDQKRPLMHRARAAMALDGRAEAKVGEALLQAMRDDTELDVLKEAQLSMHHTFKFTVPLFDLLSVETWWAQNKPSAAPTK
jgi:hypothetical protein